MDLAPGGSEELWLRQVWFARLRWIIPPLVVGLGFVVEALSRQRLFPTLPAVVLAAALVGVNVVYRTLLERWGGNADAHARELRLLAHAQVLFD
ncbi:MAG: hypothetical protein LC659_15885, partial [Myxococcales bacterium]|nr:hypothetical protein [Myxococcales bacterium]